MRADRNFLKAYQLVCEIRQTKAVVQQFIKHYDVENFIQRSENWKKYTPEGLAKKFIQQFIALEPYIKNKDIFSYRSIADLRTAFWHATNTKEQRIAEKQVLKLYEDENVLVVEPLTELASCKYGAATRWCTAAREDNQFSFYTVKNKNRLIYFIGKNNGRKHALLLDQYNEIIEGRDEDDQYVYGESILKMYNLELMDILYENTHEIIKVANNTIKENPNISLSYLLTDPSVEKIFTSLYQLINRKINERKFKTEILNNKSVKESLENVLNKMPWHPVAWQYYYFAKQSAPQQLEEQLAAQLVDIKKDSKDRLSLKVFIRELLSIYFRYKQYVDKTHYTNTIVYKAITQGSEEFTNAIEQLMKDRPGGEAFELFLNYIFSFPTSG